MGTAKCLLAVVQYIHDNPAEVELGGLVYWPGSYREHSGDSMCMESGLVFRVLGVVGLGVRESGA